MAQHDFVPAWLNFSTPQSTKSPAAIVEKHGEHLPRGEGRYAVNRRRHNSSDGFFNNGPLKTAGDSCHQPSLLRHDSVDSAVAKGTRLVQSGNQVSCHGQSRAHDAVNLRSGGNGISSNGGNGVHRHWNGNFPPRKNSTHQDKQQGEIREEKREDKKDKLQFEDEDFPSLNPEAGRPNNYNKPVGTPSGVWENPPSAKQPTKMLVIKKISKDDPVAFSAAFASPIPHLSNGGNKCSTAVPIVYKNLVPKPAPPPSKAGPWKSNGRESKQISFFSSRDSAFTSPLSVTKPAVQAPISVHSSPKESPSSLTPSIEMNSRLTRLTRRSTDKKSEFLRALKDESSEEMLESREYSKLEEIENTISEPKERDILSHSLEAEHRLLKAMGWQEYPENDENCLPLTEDELKEFHMKSEQLRSSTLRKNGFVKQCNSQLFSLWRSTFISQLSEDSQTDPSSSDTSDDDA
ncbi:vasculin-like protein 1 [Ambystoma mexicanum]|uniref:vasculin-like protein 1 n=1 Tax=Ambystoma mexicanum TaxID=8296 RepID=UPI0037E75AD0